MTIVMFCLWGLGAKAGYDVSAERQHQDTGRALSANVLSFGGIVFGSFNGVSNVLHDARFELTLATYSGPSSLRTTTAVCLPTFRHGRYSA